MYEKIKGKKLLILGGISASIEIIERARKHGVITYVTDYLENSPAKKYADKSFMVSATDVDAVVELCKRENIDGIFTGNVDLLLPYYAQICEKAGLPSYATYEQFCLMTNKVEFKKICREYGVPVIKEYTYKQAKANEIKYPVIVKPVDSSGSRGISVCKSLEELEVGIEKALSYSPSKQYIIEKYMTGDEIVIYYYFQAGNPIFVGMCDRYVLKQSEGIAQLPTAYIFPSKHTSVHIERCHEALKNMFTGLKITNGSMFLQGFIDEDGTPCIYEPGYRLNGAREQYIISAINGFDVAQMLINFALTGAMEEYDIEEKNDPFLKNKVACKLSPLIGKGVVSKIEGLDKINDLENVVKVVLNNEIGSEITDKKIGTLSQIAYRAFIVADDIEELKATIDTLQSTVVYYDKNGKSMMLDKFDTQILFDVYDDRGI